MVETLRARGDFTTFLRALDAADLTATLKAAPQIAVFAPNDAAFAALPSGQLERWMQPENRDQLRQVILYHTINAPVSSAQLLNRKGGVRTGADSEIILDGGGGRLRAGDANVVTADIRASNGTIFVLDKVLMPQGVASETPRPSGAAKGLGAAVSRGFLWRVGLQQDPARDQDDPNTQSQIPGSDNDAEPGVRAPTDSSDRTRTSPNADDTKTGDPSRNTDERNREGQMQPDPNADSDSGATMPANTDPNRAEGSGQRAGEQDRNGSGVWSGAASGRAPNDMFPMNPDGAGHDLSKAKAGDPGIVSNAPIPNPPERPRRRR